MNYMKKIFDKKKLFTVLTIFMAIVSCSTPKETVYSISNMVKVNKDTISSNVYREKVTKHQLPPISKFSKTYLMNMEENRVNAYYVYYDSLKHELYNVKELISNKDTTYIVEKKLMK